MSPDAERNHDEALWRAFETSRIVGLCRGLGLVAIACAERTMAVVAGLAPVLNAPEQVRRLRFAALAALTAALVHMTALWYVMRIGQPHQYVPAFVLAVAAALVSWRSGDFVRSWHEWRTRE